MEEEVWFDSIESFIEIVEALPTNNFAGVPPIETRSPVYNVPLQQVKIKTRNVSFETEQSPSSRGGGSVKELLQRVEALEETVQHQNTILHELYSYINNKLTVVESRIDKVK